MFEIKRWFTSKSAPVGASRADLARRLMEDDDPMQIAEELILLRDNEKNNMAREGAAKSGIASLDEFVKSVRDLGLTEEQINMILTNIANALNQVEGIVAKNEKDFKLVQMAEELKKREIGLTVKQVESYSQQLIKKKIICDFEFVKGGKGLPVLGSDRLVGIVEALDIHRRGTHSKRIDVVKDVEWFKQLLKPKIDGEFSRFRVVGHDNITNTPIIQEIPQRK